MTLTVEREYLTVAEVAALWRVSVPTIYRHVAAGRVPHIRVGGRDGPIRIPASAVVSVSVDGSPAGGSFAGADPARAPRDPKAGQVEPAGARGATEGER
jgi:excisionase family DNA binding protein